MARFQILKIFGLSRTLCARIKSSWQEKWTMNKIGSDFSGEEKAGGFVHSRRRWLSVTEGMLWCAMAVSFAGWGVHVYARCAGGGAAGWKVSMPLSEGGADFRWKVDINQADAAELALLPGIGPKRARRIIEEREINGPYLGAVSLSRVKGIGPKTAERLAPYVTAGK